MEDFFLLSVDEKHDIFTFVRGNFDMKNAIKFVSIACTNMGT